MLTITWNENDGCITHMEAERVSAQRQIDGDGIDRGRRHVFVDRPKQGVFCIDSGTVYVMNEVGRTISTYSDVGARNAVTSTA